MLKGHTERPKYLDEQFNKRIFLICIALAAGIFVIDIASLPLGVAAGVAYVAVVLISLWLSHWRSALVVAVGVSVLVILGYLFSEPAGIPWMAVANRILALSLIWFTAIVGGWLVFSKRKKTEQALQQAEEETDRARNAKSRFLESTSNDMRQHLQTLSLLGAVMRRNVVESKAQDISRKQDDAVAHLGDLLNSILEFCELESGDVEPQFTEVSITEIFQRLQGEFSPQAQAKGLHLQFGANSEVAISDGKLLTQILRSLLSNAIRYTNEGKVDVSCRRESDGLRITVEDSGIGIAVDKMAMIFDEFYRVDSDPVGQGGGRGLGLSIVDRGLTLLRTRIEVESEPGKGSIFSFVIPIP
ncbi:MAG: HAMP domain-containing histidine kinase [Gammaproteobacteria bacterium]|nr:HAMP domain-containing histidine kinase [Gammaproteobacteria bacterium]